MLSDVQRAPAHVLIAEHAGVKALLRQVELDDIQRRHFSGGYPTEPREKYAKAWASGHPHMTVAVLCDPIFVLEWCSLYVLCPLSPGCNALCMLSSREHVARKTEWTNLMKCLMSLGHSVREPVHRNDLVWPRYGFFYFYFFLTPWWQGDGKHVIPGMANQNDRDGCHNGGRRHRNFFEDDPPCKADGPPTRARLRACLWDTSPRCRKYLPSTDAAVRR